MDGDMNDRLTRGGSTDGGDEAPELATVLGGNKGGRGIVMRVPLEGGGHSVVELTPDEAAALGHERRTSRADCTE
jgi:hypothetical protein